MKQKADCAEFFLYSSPNGDIKFEVVIKNETLWLTQKKMAQLFDVNVPAISKHLKNIFDSNELKEDSVVSKMETTADDNKKYETKFYNLDTIISVGYRVNFKKATDFRIWATQILKEYLIKGFAMNDNRLKNPNYVFGKDYFDEQLERIRDIRSSERRFYQKITDIYAQCSADYNFDEKVTRDFFATIQNKLHWAITGQTAAEIVAKNYLNKDELEGLNRIVSMYLDYAENQAKKGIVMYMKDWVEKLNAFLEFNEESILKDSGKVTHEIAIKLAENEYNKYKSIEDRKYRSDFDLLMEKQAEYISQKQTK